MIGGAGRYLDGPRGYNVVRAAGGWDAQESFVRGMGKGIGIPSQSWSLPQGATGGAAIPAEEPKPVDGGSRGGTPYSVHRDELLYVALGKYLRFFHMDCPPFIAVLAITARALFGDSLLSIRVFPAAAGPR
jgi:hypothetical protein